MGSFLLSGRKLFMHVKVHRLIKDMNDRGSVRVGGSRLIINLALMSIGAIKIEAVDDR